MTKGNLTQEDRWNSQQTPGPPTTDVLSWTRSYDGFGNLTDIVEPASDGEPARRTNIEYNATPDFPSDVFYAYNSSPSAVRHWQYVWNISAGVISSKNDLDNNLTSSYQYDNVGRQTVMNEANGSRRTITEYDDVALKITVKRDLKAATDGLLQNVTHYDQLGRVRLARTSDGADLTADENTGIKVQTSYGVFSGGSCAITSTPYRTLSDVTLEWKLTKKDQLNRVTAVSMFNATQPTCQTNQTPTGTTNFQYDVTTTVGLAHLRVIDPAGKVRDEVHDSLGRLSQVVEDEPEPAKRYITTYTYDPLENLKTVSQGAQTRSFSYDSLGRLREARNSAGDSA